ncbi:hypothetical protein [uncultured Tessaracoccus sp.]|uniref:hypothetical protein n=1 Tax=uncultured Tessaracoccus sp. TaxID=905023 RepID=UPI0025E2E491|nr:hypothetical protein [uncultured Tessaracoccus sp.]
MAVIVCTGGPGSPGVTTTALTLAITWPRDVLLADCDRDPSQAVLAGYLRGLDTGGRGLASVAQAHRQGLPLADELWVHTLPLREGEAATRRFLAGFSHPGAVRLFEAAWTGLGEAFAALDARGVDVLVDAGRIGVHGLPLGLLTSADLVVVTVRSHLRSLAALRLHLPTLREQLGALPVAVPLGLAVVGPGMPYSSREIGQQFDVEPWLEIPHDPRAAAVLADGAPEPRRFAEHGHLGRARTLAKQLAERVHGLRRSREELLHV